MASRSRSGAARAARRRTRWRSVPSPRHVFRAMQAALMAAPLAVRVLVGAAVIMVAWAAVNWVYQAINKPTEVFFPVSDSLAKTPRETWQRYGSLFSEHSTTVITPELLAAIAQVEGGGNPVARTYWRWEVTWDPFELYQPASSAGGMFPITHATFPGAEGFFIHDQIVVGEG